MDAGAKGMDAGAGMRKLGPLLQQFTSERQEDGSWQYNKNKIQTVHLLNNLKNPT